mgnify:CR=1 FL=1
MDFPSLIKAMKKQRAAWFMAPINSTAMRLAREELTALTKKAIKLAKTKDEIKEVIDVSLKGSKECFAATKKLFNLCKDD